MDSYILEYNMELKYMGVQLKQILSSYMLHRINSVKSLKQDKIILLVDPSIYEEYINVYTYLDYEVVWHI